MDLFTSDFDRDALLGLVRERGYAFCNVALPPVIEQMEREMDGLQFEVGDHMTHPLNAGQPNEVRQLHARAYHLLDDAAVPYARQMCRALHDFFGSGTEPFPELKGWMPNEIGYQLYRGQSDWISPHRDRRSDRQFNVTFTIAGSALIRIHASELDPPDYRYLRQVDEFLSEPGTVMFLRAPGFGSGEQVIHEVLPPTDGTRKILNLRSRPTLLPAPTERELL